MGSPSRPSLYKIELRQKPEVLTLKTISHLSFIILLSSHVNNYVLSPYFLQVIHFFKILDCFDTIHACFWETSECSTCKSRKVCYRLKILRGLRRFEITQDDRSIMSCKRKPQMLGMFTSSFETDSSIYLG